MTLLYPPLSELTERCSDKTAPPQVLDATMTTIDLVVERWVHWVRAYYSVGDLDSSSSSNSFESRLRAQLFMFQFQESSFHAVANFENAALPCTSAQIKANLIEIKIVGSRGLRGLHYGSRDEGLPWLPSWQSAAGHIEHFQFYRHYFCK